MVTEIQKRLHEALEREPYPEARLFKKEAVIVGDHGREQPLDRSATCTTRNSTATATASTRDNEQAEARRRRIYENEYNRPYPKSSTKITFWSSSSTSDPAKAAATTTTTAAAAVVGMTGQLVTPSPKPCPNTANNPATSNSTSQYQDLIPRNLWQSDSVSEKENYNITSNTNANDCEPGHGNEIENDIPQIPVVIKAKPKKIKSLRRQRLQETDSYKNDANNNNNNKKKDTTGTMDDIPSITSASCFKPIHFVSPLQECQPENISPLTLPKTTSTEVGATDTTAADSNDDDDVINLLYGNHGECQPQESWKNACAPIQPVMESTGLDLNININSMNMNSFKVNSFNMGAFKMEFQSFAPHRDVVVTTPDPNTTTNQSKPQSSPPPPPSTSKTNTPQHPHESHQSLHRFLKDNAETRLELHIDDYQESTFDKIVESLYGNSVLETMSIIRSLKTQIGTYRSPSEMECVFEAMRCLPNLKTLLLIDFGEDVMEYLADNLPSSLERIHLRVIDGGIPDTVLDALARKANLVNVHFEIRESIDLGRLLASPTLQTLKVCGMGFAMDGAHMHAFGQALVDNPCTNLMAMDLEPDLDLASWQALAQGLGQNKSLKHLRISFTGATDEDHEEAVKTLAHLIQDNNNSTLTNVKNRTHDSVHVPTNVAKDVFLQAVHSNNTLQELHFFQEDPLIWVTKEAILKRNYHHYQATEAASSMGTCPPILLGKVGFGQGTESLQLDHLYESCVQWAHSIPGVDDWNWCGLRASEQHDSTISTATTTVTDTSTNTPAASSAYCESEF